MVQIRVSPKLFLTLIKNVLEIIIFSLTQSHINNDRLQTTEFKNLLKYYLYLYHNYDSLLKVTVFCIKIRLHDT